MSAAETFYALAVALMAAVVAVMLAIVCLTRAAVWVLTRWERRTIRPDLGVDEYVDAARARDDDTLAVAGLDDLAAWEREVGS